MVLNAKNNTAIGPYSPLRGEVTLDPLLREAMDAVMQLGASPIQASWSMIGWTLDALIARGVDVDLLAADLRAVADDFEQRCPQRDAA